MASIDFYYNPMSRARIVHWGLEEFGIEYKMRHLDFNKGEHKAADFLKINPMGKVPALVHNGVIITEAAAILAYLADVFPEARLAPDPKDPRRGIYLRWLFFTATNFEAAVMDRSYPRSNSPRPGMLGYGSYDDMLDACEKALQPGPYILGDEFTIADVYLGAQIGWGIQFKTVDPRPAFTRYLSILHDRPAWKRSEEHAAKLMAEIQKSKG